MQVTPAIAAAYQDLTSRRDAIVTVLDNLRQVFPDLDAPAPIVTRKARARGRTPRPVADLKEASVAAQRRLDLMAAIEKAPHGLTLAELRKQFPKMDGKDRSNTLHRLKLEGQIRRSGNSWIKAA